MSSILDDISAELNNLSDEEIAEAAQKILASRQRAQASMTPERKEKMKAAEKRRRQKNSELLKLAKAKGLVAGA